MTHHGHNSEPILWRYLFLSLTAFGLGVLAFRFFPDLKAPGVSFMLLAGFWLSDLLNNNAKEVEGNLRRQAERLTLEIQKENYFLKREISVMRGELVEPYGRDLPNESGTI